MLPDWSGRLLVSTDMRSFDKAEKLLPMNESGRFIASDMRGIELPDLLCGTPAHVADSRRGCEVGRLVNRLSVDS